LALEKASAEFVEAKMFNADRAEERSNLGSFYARQGKASLAEVEYLAAIKLSPHQPLAYVNLADLYRALERERDAEAILRRAIVETPDAAAAHYALGLSLIRQKRIGDAVQSLKQAAELEPANARYAYVYALALQSAGQASDARQVLTKALAANPSSVEILAVLLQDALQARDYPSALSYAERLRALRPNDATIATLTERIRSAIH
jgi:Flp pilus assembly protein TadD